MPKTRVYQLAKEYDIPSKDFVTLLNQYDVPVKNHMSALTDDQISRFKGTFKKEDWDKNKSRRAEAPAGNPGKRRQEAGKRRKPLRRGDGHRGGPLPARRAQALGGRSGVRAGMTRTWSPGKHGRSVAGPPVNGGWPRAAALRPVAGPAPCGAVTGPCGRRCPAGQQAGGPSAGGRRCCRQGKHPGRRC